MTAITTDELHIFLTELLQKYGLNEENSHIVADIYIEEAKRGVGHHDLHNLPSRLDALEDDLVKPDPVFTETASFGALEQWDGNNGLGEVINHFSMERAIALAQEHGVGICTFRNSNHYLCSMPYIMQAVHAGCIGLMIAKGQPTMGIPGSTVNVIGQSPIGFAFPVGKSNPVAFDACLAYVSGEELAQRASRNEQIPFWWGVDGNGNPTSSAKELLTGIKNPIGEHKGFALAILCELLTGVFSGGLVLDEKDDTPHAPGRSSSHTAIAIRTDALMSPEEYAEKSRQLVTRLRARDEKVHIPGERAWVHIRACDECKKIDLDEDLISALNLYAEKKGIEKRLAFDFLKEGAPAAT